MKAQAILGAIVLAMATGCGGESKSDNPPNAKDTVSAQQKAYDTCKETTAGLHDAVQEMVSRTPIGVSLEDFTTLLGTAKVEADRIDQSGLDTDCADVFTDLAESFNALSEFQGGWKSCQQVAATLCATSGGALDIDSSGEEPSFDIAKDKLAQADDELAAMASP